MKEVTVSRKAHFNAAHRLFHKDWTNEKNAAVFGLCSNPNYHGHNYELIVSVTGKINQETGMVIDLKELKNLIYQHVELHLDHKNLNLDIVYFKNTIPTAENIVVYIYDILKKYIAAPLKLQITLYETPRNFVKYPINI